MNIIVTGGAGFIGFNLCKKLLELQHKVICIDNFNDFYNPKIKYDNIKTIELNKNFVLYKQDIRDCNKINNIFTNEKPHLVIHLAAMAGVRASIKNPVLYNDVNVNGTLNMLQACKNNNVDKFIFASSSSVYGNNKTVPFTEDDDVSKPISPYAYTKKAGELLCHTYHSLYNISTVALRFFTVYGPGQRPDLAIHKFCKNIMQNKPITVFGDGSSKRDYTYIDDIVNGIVSAISFINKNNCFEIFNLGNNNTVSLKYMIQVIEDVIGKKAIKNILPMQPGDVNVTYASIDKSKKILAYCPKTTFEQGIKNFIYWYKN